MAIICVSKAATEALAEGYQYELSTFGIDSVIVEPGHFPTNLLASQDEPNNQSIIKEYGKVGEIEKELMKQTIELLNGENVQDPQVVADEILKLIQTPKTKRPFRLIPGEIDMGLSKLNEAKIKAQTTAVEMVGLTELAPRLFKQ